MKKLKLISILLTSLVFSGSALAAIDFEDATFPELITSARALAMGNAFICKVDDSSAPFYNPAGLGTVRYAHLHFSNIAVEVNKNWTEHVGSGHRTEVVETVPKGFDLDGTRELLLENTGEVSHRRVQAAPNLTTRHFSMGYLYSMRTRGFIGGEATDEFEYADRTDHGPYAALSLPLFGGIMKFGLMTSYLNRKEVIDSSPRTQKVDLSSGDYNQGSGFYSVGGFRLTLPWTFLPTFAVTRHNAFGSGWSNESGAGAPEKIKPNTVVGFSVTPQIGKVTRVHFEVNYKDATGEYDDVATSRKIMAGMEIDFARTIFLRAGYGDGFGSGGVGIRTQAIEFDLTTYAVDAEPTGFMKEEDRRYMLSFSTGF